jgi:AmiR/NasT family two-component response regulator
VLALEREVRVLRAAVTAAPGIQRAVGILMARLGCTPLEAFSLMRQRALDRNVRVADVAVEVHRRTLPGTRHPPEDGPRRREALLWPEQW